MSPKLLTLLLAVGCLVGCDDPAPAPTDAGTDAALPDAGGPPPTVVTADGALIGERQSGGSLSFLGIPFAAPPVGDLRFMAPEPPAPWTEPRTSRRPPRCAQNALGFSLASQEDCLYLNVHTPDPMPESAPVMVWIHGGAFLFGEGLQTDNGTAGDLLAQRHGVIVVSMNYRLGPFGFLAHPALSTEQGGTSGNYGIMDQRVALEWVRDNIAAFGGDPGNVTLFGESAGGYSVCSHLISPASRGLFHRAIVESGLCDDPQTFGLTEAEAVGVEIAGALGCDTGDIAACLRAASLQAWLEADGPAGTDPFAELTQRRQWWATVDGAVIPADFVTQVRAGEVADVPTIMGWNADEGTLFVLLAEQAGLVIDETAYAALMASLATQYGVEEAAVLSQYPLSSFDDPGAAVAAALGHASLACPSRRAARAMAEEGMDVRVYRFTYPDAEFQLPSDRDLGAFHSAEIQYVFGHPSNIGRSRFNGDDLALHQEMSALFTDFAAGSPSADWPSHTVENDLHLVLDRTIETGTGSDLEVCDLWEPAPGG